MENMQKERNEKSEQVKNILLQTLELLASTC